MGPISPRSAVPGVCIGGGNSFDPMDGSPLETVLDSAGDGTPGIDNSISYYNWYFKGATDKQCHAYLPQQIIMDPKITKNI